MGILLLRESLGGREGHRGETNCSSAVHLQCCRTKPQHRDEKQRPPVPGRHLRRGQGGGRGARHVSKNNGVVRIATKKFVKKMTTSKDSPKLDLKIYEKLTGAPKAIEAKIVTLEEVVLTDPTEVADHNLKKLRTALNMITG